MRKSRGNLARQVYRVFLKAFPRAFRDQHGPEMEETFLILLEWEGREKGLGGKVRAWASALWDALSVGFRLRLRGGAENAGGGPNPSNSGLFSGGREMIHALGREMRLTFRGLARKPLFALTVLLSLAVGIGANASVFTLVDGLLLKPLPYEEPEELITLWEEYTVHGWNGVNVSPLNARDWGERAHTVEDIATFYAQDQTLTGLGEPALLPVVRVSANMFDLLGRAPALGRGFSVDEVGVDRDNVVILTHGFWQRQFGGDRSVLGQSMELQGRSRTIVGVLPPEFRFLDEEPALFLPLDLIPTDHARHEHFLKAVSRLSEGYGIDEARVEFDNIALQLASEFPESNEGWKVEVRSVRDDLLGPSARPAALILMVAVAFVLLMVCVNVANLALARGEQRTRELAIRTALGAGRGRIVRQLFAESLTLALLGGALGLLLANWGYRAVVATLPNHTSPNFQFGLDGSVVGFTLATTLLAAVLFGTAPAVRFSRASVVALRDGGRSGLTTKASRFGSFLVVLQTALALVLLVGGGVLTKRIVQMRAQDLGFEPEHAITVRVSPPTTDYPEAADITAFWSAVEDRIAQVPGVLSVGSTQVHPLMGDTWIQTVRVAGQDQERSARLLYATGGLFDALGFQTVQGRPLSAQDDDATGGAAVVNEAFVRTYLAPGTDPLGVTLENTSDSQPGMSIVGVIQDVFEGGVDQTPDPAIYRPFSDLGVRRRSLVIRTSTPPAEALPVIRDAVWSVDPNVPLDRTETLQSQVDRQIGGFAVVANLMAAFAILSLFLGALGIYGVTAYAAGRRTNEIGIRMALGARRGDVVKMVVKQGGRRAVLGLVLGLVLAVSTARILGSVMVGVEPLDPGIFIAVTGILGGVSLLALWIPARRASKVGPVAALDQE
jgi:putative ABC transport system permease protein